MCKDGGCKGVMVRAKLWAGVGACSEDVGCCFWEAGGAEGWVWGSALCPALPRIPLGAAAGPHPAPGPDAAGGPCQHHRGGTAVPTLAPGPGLSRGTAPPPHTPPSPLLQDPDFAEVLSELSARELQWLVQGQLRIVAETEGRHARQLAGTITARRSCDSEHGHPGAQGAAVPPSPASPPPPPRSSLPGFKPSRACCAGRTPCCRPRRGPWARPS